MNRFAELLKKTLRPSPPALGFRASAPSCKPHPLLVAGIKSLEAGEARDYEGVDALIFSFENATTLKALKQAACLAAAKPWGLFIKSGEKNIQQAIKASADFVVVNAKATDISILDYSELGKVLVVDGELDDTLLKAGSGLPFDAIVLEQRKNSISCLDLMYYRKVAAAASKPVLLAISSDLTQNSLQILWESGIDGVLVYSSDVTVLTRLRHSIDSASFIERGQGKMRPVVPVLGGQSFGVPEEPPPDEGEDDD